MNKILIIDDKEENLYLLESMLEPCGYKTIRARNGAEALGLIKKEIPDIIISDILMPVMDGFTLCIECKKDPVLKNIPFVFYTATYVDPRDEEYALSLGADRFILKTEEPDVFIKIINDFIDEVKNKKIRPKEANQQQETIILKEYNEVLIRKLEDKMLQSERAEKELRKYAKKLEAEITERKKKEEALIKSEEYNRILFTTSPIGLVVSTIEGNLVDVNPAFLKIIGRTIEETINLNWKDITPEKYLKQEEIIIESIDKHGFFGKYEKELIHKKGYLVNVVMQGLIFISEGERMILSSVEDITEKKKNEIALQESQRLFHTLAQVSPVGIFRTDSEGRITYVNPRWLELSGLSAEEASEEEWIKVLHPEDKVRVIQSLKEGFSNKRKTNDEFRLLRSDGKIIWVTAKAVPVWTGSEFSGYVGTITDITELKKSEELLKSSEERLKILFDYAPDAYYLCNLEGVFIDGNIAAENLLGYSKHELIGKNFLKLDLLSPEQLQLAGALLEKNMAGESTGPSEFEIKRKDNTKVYVEIISHPVKIQNEILVLGVARDITERKKVSEALRIAKEKAEANDRLKTNFLNNISHEVRTPLNGILGFAELMSQGYLSEEEKQEAIKLLYESSERLLDTITNYMDISLINSGNITVNTKLFEPEKILEELYKKFTERCNSRNLQFTLEKKEDSPKIYLNSDPEIFRKVLYHLIDNAIKFTESGSISYGYNLKENEIEFFVKDTGIGISKEYQEKIFECFFKEERLDLLKVTEGSGLGLSISKGLVELLGGRIWVESEKGKGSCFFISLPLGKESEIYTKKNSSGCDKSSNKTGYILVAEDDDSNFFFLNTLLRQSIPMDIIRAHDGKEAVDIFEKTPDIGLVLMDIKMPVMNGLEATKQIKKIRKNIPVIAVTAYAMAGDEQNILDAGCDSYISKPLNKNQLIEKISEFIIF